MNRIILYILLFIFSVHLHAQEQFSVFFASDQFELNKTEILRLKQFIENHKNSKWFDLDCYVGARCVYL